MSFGGLTARLGHLSSTDLYLTAVAVLLMFMIATYLLIRRGSIWYMLCGLAFGALATLYTLSLIGVVRLDHSLVSSFFGG